MADQKITELDANTTPASTDLTVIVDDPGSTPATQKMTLDTLDDYLSDSSKTLTNKTLTSPVIQAYDGWQDANETWTFSSVDDPTGVITAPGDLTGKYGVGMRIKLTNGGNTIYGIISKDPVYSDPNTTITFLHEIDPTDSQALHLMADSAITANYYSSAKAPLNFPLDPDKWAIKLEYRTATITYADPATGGTLYSSDTARLELPIGVWNCHYRGGALKSVRVGGSAHSHGATLSSDGTTETNPESSYYGANPDSINVSFGPKGQGVIEKTTKGYIYLMALANQTTVGALTLDCSAVVGSALVIKATSAYL